MKTLFTIFFVLRYFGRELYCRMEFVSFFNKSCWNLWNFFALCFSINKVHLTAIIQGTWRNILFFTNYTQIIIIVVNYQDYNYLIL